MPICDNSFFVVQFGPLDSVADALGGQFELFCQLVQRPICSNQFQGPLAKFSQVG